MGPTNKSSNPSLWDPSARLDNPFLSNLLLDKEASLNLMAKCDLGWKAPYLLAKELVPKEDSNLSRRKKRRALCLISATFSSILGGLLTSQ